MKGETYKIISLNDEKKKEKKGKNEGEYLVFLI